MASDEVQPIDAVPEGNERVVSTSGADEPQAELPDGWWQHVLPAYMPAGAWRPHVDGESSLTAPVAPGSWMPPASSFHALRPGSSLATESGEPVVPTLAALASATTIPGLAHGTSVDLTALDDAVPELAGMTAAVPGGASALEKVRAATEQGETLSEQVPDAVSSAVRAYDPGAFDRAQSAIARYASEDGTANALVDATRAAGIPADATPRQAVERVRQLATGTQRPVVPTSIVERHRAQVSRLVTTSAVLAGIVIVTIFVFLNLDDESAGFIGLGLIGVGLVQAGFFVWAIVLAVRGRVLRIPAEGARPLYALLLLTLCSPVPVFILRSVLEVFA